MHPLPSARVYMPHLYQGMLDQCLNRLDLETIEAGEVCDWDSACKLAGDSVGDFFGVGKGVFPTFQARGDELLHQPWIVLDQPSVGEKCVPVKIDAIGCWAKFGQAQS